LTLVLYWIVALVFAREESPNTAPTLVGEQGSG